MELGRLATKQASKQATKQAKKTFFLSVGKTKCWLEKKLSVGNFFSVGEKNGNVRTFPGMQDRKTAEAGKNALGPIGRGKKVEIFFCQLVEKNVGWKKNASGPG